MAQLGVVRLDKHGGVPAMIDRIHGAAKHFATLNRIHIGRSFARKPGPASKIGFAPRPGRKFLSPISRAGPYQSTATASRIG